MKSIVVLLGLAFGLLLVNVPGVCLAAPVYPGCDAPPTSYGHSYEADSGSFRAMLAKLRPGDILYLKSGNYGQVELRGNNSAFVTVAAGEGQSPQLSSLVVEGSHWMVRGLTISGFADAATKNNGWHVHNPLLTLDRGDNIVVENNTVASVVGAFPWKMEINGEAAPDAAADGMHTNNTACVSIYDNHVYNVFTAIQVSGDQVGNDGKLYLVARNRIDNFAGDGIDHSVSDALIVDNVITDAHNVCDYKCIHMDGIQGWNYHDQTGITNRNISIERNTIIYRTVPNLPLLADDLHGITIFDGAWDGVRVRNNVIVTTGWHGITLFGVQNSSIVNNTVVAAGDRATYIKVANAKPKYGSTEPRNVVVRNNIAPAIGSKGRAPQPAGVTTDHNYIIDDPRSLFKVFDPAGGHFDLHPRDRARIIGAGAPDLAPDTNIEGLKRGGSPNIGAY